MHDVMIIGGGAGGYAAAIRASQLGAKVVLAEAGETGGTCVNRGCIPSKIWLQAGNYLRGIASGKEFGINASVEKIDLNAITERKNGVSGDIRMGMEGLLQNNGVDLVRGQAVLKNPHQADVEGRLLDAQKIIIATGSSLSFPDIPGLKQAAITTDQVLEMREAPSSVLICESGPWEVEMACLLNTFGCKVVLAASSRVLPQEDQDTSQRIAQALREQGVEILPRVALKSVEKAKTGCSCVLTGAKDRTVEVEKVLISSRMPNTTDMGLDQIGVELNEDGSIRVNNKLETSAEGVCAIGDVTGGWMLSHAASSMGVFAAENAMGKPGEFPFHLISRGLWTFPEVGSVGLSEEEAEKKGMDVEVGDFPYSINGLAMCRSQTDGAVKVVSDARYGEILGVHIVGSCATELIGEAVLAMQLEATVNELARSIRMHPTFSETVADAARDAAGWALYLPKR